MARIRYIKPDFFKDEDLAELPYEARLFFAGMWCHADKAGRLEDRPARLKAEIFPYDAKFDANRALEILANPKKHSPNGRPFVIRYAIDGDRFIQIVAWEKHQKPHHTEAESVIPPPPPNNGKGNMNGDYKGECSSSECSDDEPNNNRSITVKPARINFNATSRAWEGISPEDMEAWSKAFPACDLNSELAQMIEWIIGNPAKGKKSHYRRFITGWLSRSQNRGGGRGGNERSKLESPRVGASPKQEHDADYWAKVRQRHAEGKKGDSDD